MEIAWRTFDAFFNKLHYIQKGKVLKILARYKELIFNYYYFLNIKRH